MILSLDIVEKVARRYGRDAAHDVFLTALKRRPVEKPLIWAYKVARQMTFSEWKRQDVRAGKYDLEAEWTTVRRVSPPDVVASCLEVLDKIPRDVVMELVELEGVGGSKASARRHALRQRAVYAARGIHTNVRSAHTPGRRRGAAVGWREFV